jgi:hypothetical protein
MPKPLMFLACLLLLGLAVAQVTEPAAAVIDVATTPPPPLADPLDAFIAPPVVLPEPPEDDSNV